MHIYIHMAHIHIYIYMAHIHIYIYTWLICMYIHMAHTHLYVFKMVGTGYGFLKFFSGFFSTGAEYKHFPIKSANKQSSYNDHSE
jgi:hypothetical protein